MNFGGTTSDSRQRPVFTSTGRSYISRDTGFDGGAPGMFSQDIRYGTDPITKKLLGIGDNPGAAPTYRLNLDPSIRGGEEAALSGMSKAYGALGSQLSQLRQSAYGSLPEYVQASTDPMRQAFAQQMGGLRQNLGSRGLSGSTFFGQSIGSLGADQQRALQNAVAQATMQGTQGIAGLSQQEAEAAKALADYQNQIAQQRAQRDLGILGLLGTESSSFGIQAGIGGKGGGGMGKG